VQALRSLPEDTRRGVAGLAREHGAGAREHLAYQALGDWTPGQREALRTLAAAGPEIRAQAVTDVLGPATAGPERTADDREEPPGPESVLIDDSPRHPTSAGGPSSVDPPAPSPSTGEPPDTGGVR
jgi:hypothetical protein